MIPEKVNPAALQPIIYVRGYAMTRGDIDETTADPFCGFNLGSTVFRATADRKSPPRKFVFESPLVRLTSDFGYSDVYTDGHDIVDPDWDRASITRQSLIIYRYYDSASTLLGDGTTPKIEEFAKGLSRLIARVRDLVCKDDPDSFRCYLVAHSMGGLVCRTFLQNEKCDEAGSRRYVDKFFTYATPHNGIDMAGLNVPEWLETNDIYNFSREHMAEYLNVQDLYKQTGRVDWLPAHVPLSPEKVFCLIGTNRSDYEVAKGLSRTFAGDGSDGLVRIENAWLCGAGADAKPIPTAKAFVYRSHSGYFGIVNSEESYQNLTRFLFGDVRVDIWLDIKDIRLPEAVAAKEKAGQEVNALYQFEVLASPRGKLWYLTRRIAEEDSVACLPYKNWKSSSSLYVSTVFLALRAQVTGKSSLAYSMTLGVRVPDYEVDRKLWINEHYEGGYLFRDSVIIEIFPPGQDGGDWNIECEWQSQKGHVISTTVPTAGLNNSRFTVPLAFGSATTTPGINGELRFIVSRWNS